MVTIVWAHPSALWPVSGLLAWGQPLVVEGGARSEEERMVLWWIANQQIKLNIGHVICWGLKRLRTIFSNHYLPSHHIDSSSSPSFSSFSDERGLGLGADPQVCFPPLFLLLLLLIIIYLLLDYMYRIDYRSGTTTTNGNTTHHQHQWIWLCCYRLNVRPLLEVITRLRNSLINLFSFNYFLILHLW